MSDVRPFPLGCGGDQRSRPSDLRPCSAAAAVVDHPRMEVDRNGLEVLDRDECIRLLGTATLGRLAVTSGSLPTVFPVNFLLDDDRIVVSTSRGTKLDAAIQDAVVAFEVDDFDPGHGRGMERRCHRLVTRGRGSRRGGSSPIGADGPVGAARQRPNRRHLHRADLRPAAVARSPRVGRSQAVKRFDARTGIEWIDRDECPTCGRCCPPGRTTPGRFPTQRPLAARGARRGARLGWPCS